MSDDWITWTIEHSPYSGGALVVHLTLALAADVDGNIEGLSHTAIAAIGRCSFGHVARLVREMEREGLLTIVAPPIGRRPAAMRLVRLDLPAVARAPERGQTPVARASARGQRPKPTPPPEPVARASAPGLQETPDPHTLISLPNALPPPCNASRSKPERATEPALFDVPADLADARPVVKRPARKPRKHETEARTIVDAVWLRLDPKPAQPYIAIVKIAEALLASGWAAPSIENAMCAVPTISTRWVESALRRARGGPTSPGATIDRDRTQPTGEVKL
jgi:hypothetical protein